MLIKRIIHRIGPRLFYVTDYDGRVSKADALGHFVCNYYEGGVEIGLQLP